MLLPNNGGTVQIFQHLKNIVSYTVYLDLIHGVWISIIMIHLLIIVAHGAFSQLLNCE